MKNNKSNLKSLPEKTIFNSSIAHKENRTLLEILIINLINNGASLDEIMNIATQLENKKESEEIKTKITNILFRLLSDF